MKSRSNSSNTLFRILISLAIGLSMGLTGTVHAEEDMSGQEKSHSSSKSSTPKQPCAGPSGIQCPGGMKCIDDPGDKCDPTKEGTNCPGICVAGAPVSKVKQPCAGPTGIVCQGGMICVDDPSDECDPTKEGINCKGICMSK